MRKTALVVLTLLVVLTSGCNMWTEKKNPSWKQATSGEHLGRLLWDDLASSRWDSVERRVAEFAIVTDGSRSHSGRDAVVSYFKSLHVPSAQIGELESRMNGADLVTTYTVAIGSAEPKRMLTVWQQVGDDWLLVAHSSTGTLKD